MSIPARPPARTGRRPATSRADLERLALRLFDERGFEETTVDDIAAAAGIGRRTFFRYYASKNDVVWGEFEAGLARMRALLSATPGDQPMMEALRVAILEFNRLDLTEVPWHRRRMSLILRVPALQAHSTLRYAQWREVVADFVAGRLVQPPDALLPQVIGYAALGTAVAAYEQWLRVLDAGLDTLLDEALRELAAGFHGHERRR